MSEYFKGTSEHQPVVQLEMDLWIEPTPEEQVEIDRFTQYWDSVFLNEPMPIQRPDQEMREVVHLLHHYHELIDIDPNEQVLLPIKSEQPRGDS
jgi:hypothetical protein